MNRIKTTTFSLLAVLICGLAAGQAQERLSRNEALKYSFIACGDLKQLKGTPIPTDPDVKYPVVIRDGEYGGMAMPETKLGVDVLARTGAEVIPVGQLWLHKLVPLVDGRVVAADRLRMLKMESPEGEVEVSCCALGVRKTGQDGLELLVYGKSREPVCRAQLKAISKSQEQPLELAAERQSDGGMLTLTFLGKYEASFQVTDPELY